MDGRNYEFLCRRLALLQNTGIFCEENGELISWQENPERMHTECVSGAF